MFFLVKPFFGENIPFAIIDIFKFIVLVFNRYRYNLNLNSLNQMSALDSEYYNFRLWISCLVFIFD